MVKAMARLSDGRVLLVLGISDGNIARLKKGEPIYFDAAAVKLNPHELLSAAVTLFYGKDEAELGRTLKTLIGPETEVITVPRGDERPQ
jgi:hypothetical protein